MRELLLQLLLADRQAAAEAGDRITRSGSWGQCVRLAHGWGALPRLNHRLPLLAAQPADTELAEISKLNLDGYVRSVLQARRGIEVLHALEHHDIAAVAFKGLAAMAVLYGSAQERIMADVDVLINERDLERAAEVITQLGFRPAVACELAEYVAFVRRAPGFGGNEELSFSDDRGSNIDLHWRLGGILDPPDAIARSQPATLLEERFPAVSLEDGLLLCVHHSLRNHFGPGGSIRDLLDLELWCERLTQAGRVESVLHEAMEARLAAPLLAMTTILGRLNEGSAAAGVASRLERTVPAGQRKTARRLRTLFYSQVREGEFDREVLYLLRPRELKQILDGVLSGGRRHIALARSMDGALAGETVSFWQRLSAVGKSVRRLRPRHVRMLMALARAKDQVERT